MNAKIGRDTPLIGEMRTRVNNGRPVLYFETSDAGALFRFTDIYPRMVGGKMWIGMDPPTQDRLAAGRHHQRQRLHDPRRGRARQVVSECAECGAPEQQHRVRPGARRFHPRAGTHDDQGRRAARADDRRHRRRQHRLRARPGPACAARWCRSTASTTCSARFRSSACSSAAAQRGHLRHHLRGDRPDRQSAPDGQSDFGDCAGHAAQILRVSRSAGSRSYVWRAVGPLNAQAGLISTCRFLPSESLMTPSGVSVAGVSTIFSSVTVTSLTLSPPPLI